MKSILIREPSVSGTTFGALYIENDFECFTLEDQIRPFPNKIPGQTAIWGDKTYEITLDFSPKFGRIMPHVNGVDMFTGIRIHPVKNKEWTEGCIGVGKIKTGLELREYHEAFDALFLKLQKIEAHGERMYLTIVNPPEPLEPAGIAPPWPPEAGTA
jgi:hypothetical protein